MKSKKTALPVPSFLAKISYELRSPLSLIVCLLEDELKKRPDSESLQLIKQSASCLMDLADQLSEIAAPGPSILHVQQGDVSACLSVVAACYDLLSEQKKIKFIKKISLTEWPIVWYDEEKLQKIISHLLAHAFRVTLPNGVVSLTARINTVSSGYVLHITVSDTGDGIPDEEQADLFLPFYQVKNSKQSTGDGFGLSLSIASEAVKLYGGTITCKSIVGLGTRFTVQLPASKEVFSPAQFIEANNPSTIHRPVTAFVSEDVQMKGDDNENTPKKDTILIVEDNADLLKFISSSLAQQFFVKTAMNGEDAFREATAIIPDLVVTDLVIPRINGIELVKKIKQDERTSHIPVILITGKNDSLSRLEGLRAGVDDYLAKPFSTDELLLRIGNLIEQRKHLAKRYRERMANNPIPAKKLSFDEQFLQQVRATAESNLKDVTFSVSKMAEQMYVNRTYLLRKLKSLTGIAPNGYIKNLRMEKAAEMIRLKVNTIAQIGYAVGFNDQSYFTKCFKKHFGITPSEYAAKNAVP